MEFEYTETDDFRLRLVNELLKKVQDECLLLESEVNEEARTSLESFQNTLSMARCLIRVIRDCQ